MGKLSIKISEKYHYSPSKTDLLEMIASLFILSFGVALSVKANLGSSPISSLPNVLSIFSGLSLGTTMLITNVTMIVAEWVIMHDRTKIIYTMVQLPFTIIQSVFVDIIMMPMDGWFVTDLVQQWGLVIISNLIIAFGVVLSIDSNVSLLADDGLILAIHGATRVRLDKVMLLFDIAFIGSAFIASYIFFQDFVGVGLGTIVAGLTLGPFVKILTTFVKRHVRSNGHIVDEK